MIIDFAYRLIRKKFNKNLFYLLKNKIVQPKRADAFIDIAEKYINTINVKNKIVSEIGGGDQLYTPIYLIYAGAREVIVVEPCIGENLKQQLAQYQAEIEKKFPHKISREELVKRIKIYKQGVDEKNLLINYPEKIDVIFSHTTLEHVPDLNQTFKNFNLWLKKQGQMYHIVDFSDHLYHPFMPTPLKFLLNKKFRHLKYSRKTWKKVNDQKTCYMNRKLLPHYKKLVRDYDFEIINISASPAPMRVNIHPDVLAGLKNINPDDLKIANIEILLKKN